MTLRVLFIVLPNIPKSSNLSPSKITFRRVKEFPYGVLSMATYLSRNFDAEVDVFDCNIPVTPDTYLSRLGTHLTASQPDIVAISMMFDHSYHYLTDILSTVSAHATHALIVIGGASATSSYEDLLYRHQNITAVCYYDGELPMYHLVSSQHRTSILNNHPSWITRASLSNNRKPVKSLLPNLNTVIDIDYGFVDISDYCMEESFSPYSNRFKERRQFPIVTSRGCPFRCTFCMHSNDSDKRIRYADVDSIISHISHLVNAYNLNVLTIYDDQLVFNRNRAKDLFRRLAQFNLRIECPSGLSVAFLDEELIRLMKQAGMDTAYLAIESGSPYVLNELMDKPLKLHQVKPVIDILRLYDFWISGFFVLGMPGETDIHRQQTKDFISRIGLDWSLFNLAYPVRGSKLYDLCIERSYLQHAIALGDMDTGGRFIEYIIQQPDVTPEYISEQMYLMNLELNFINNYRLINGDFDTAIACFTDIIRLYPDHPFAHLCLYKAYKYHNDSLSQALSHYDEAKRIVANSEEWKHYVDRLGVSDFDT